MSQPVPPENVRVVLADGTEVPIECRYDGLTDGVHCWMAAITLRQPVQEIIVDRWPADTSIGFDVELELDWP